MTAPPDDAPALGPADPGIPEFYIPATSSLEERRPRTLKHGDTFAVFDHNGDILSGPGSPEGLFHRDTRHLAHLDLRLSGTRPMLLSSTLREDNDALACDLTNPDLFEAGRLVVERDIIHVRRLTFLWNGTCHERLVVRNFSGSRQKLRLELRFAADFADVFEVRGMTRPRRGALAPPQVGGDTVLFSYDGLDGIRRTTRLRFDPAPDTLSAGNARFNLDLDPHGSIVIGLDAGCQGREPERPARAAFMTCLREARRRLGQARKRAASIGCSNSIFDEAARRSMADLAMLTTDTPTGPYPYAGIPWFSTAFGRDALITAHEVLWLDPALALGVLRFLAANQATVEDAATDAEPGKILHEARAGEMAELGEVPFKRYYGSVDSTPLFVMLAGAYLERTGEVEALRALWPHIEAALGWLDRHRDADGFISYDRRSKDGLANQGWKDSHDSVFHQDGRLAKGPIALVEVQGYAFAARRAAAAIAHRLGDVARSNALDEQADHLRRRFEDAFWSEELGTYVLALDGERRPCRVRASNAGHTLFTGIASSDRAARVVERLMDAASFSGWGVRTLAGSEVRYNPMSYHNGSVWPHDNALIAMGLARYGYKGAVARVFEGLFAASAWTDMRRLPELFCGFPRRRGHGPTAYPVACSPQAWAAATPFALLQASLGLTFDPWRRRIRFDRPRLPAFLDEVTLRGVRLGEASVDLLIRRHGDEVVASPIGRSGDITVVTLS